METGTIGRTRHSKQQPDNIRKVAVTMQGKQALFLGLDQNRPLAAIIQDICNQWLLSESENYALQFTETNRQTYITERNRNEIQSGNVLQITYSQAKTAQMVLDKLKEKRKDMKLDALKQLSTLSADSSFAQEFISKNGLPLVTGIVTSGQYQGQPLAFALKSFVCLMDHSIVMWDVLEQDFIRKVSECVNFPTSIMDISCIQSALEILESVVLHSGKHLFVEQVVSPVNVIQHLQSSKKEVQKNGIALINALFLKADHEKRKKMAESLHSKSFRNVVLNQIIQPSSSIDAEMVHQLYVLQTLMLNLLEERMMTPADPVENAKDIIELRKIAFDIEGDNAFRKNATVSKDFSKDASKDAKKLGFVNVSNPLDDLKETPPGVLALDCVLHFARHHNENYIKVVLENSSRADEHDCPFAYASKMLTKYLCEILKIGEPPSEEGQVFYQMFFCHDRPFEEFFCICIQLLNKTWKEMKATSQDFQKVLGVVKEQIGRGLDIQPTSFDIFRSRLNQLTYAEIIRNWEKERLNKEEWESQAQPILELRQQIIPEIVELIKRQRLNCLMEGMRFSKFHARGRMKDKYWYWRMSPNLKAFHYGDCGETEMPSIEQLPNKLSVVDIKMLQTGKDCQHVRENKKKNIPANLAFTIIPVTSEPLHFVTTNEQEFNIWTDGINALLGNDMTSSQMKDELEILLGMEIKLQLLDTEGITIPAMPPPVPKEPDNYDFVYNI